MACVDVAAALRVAGITCPILIVGLAFPKASVEIKPPASENAMLLTMNMAADQAA